MSRKEEHSRQEIDWIPLGSFSADQPISIEFSQGSDDLQPCIEDIRHEIDRLRREEQQLRERLEKFSSSDQNLRFLAVSVVQLNPIVLVLVPFQVHRKRNAKLSFHFRLILHLIYSKKS